MISKLKKHGLMVMAAALLVAMAFAGVAVAADTAYTPNLAWYDDHQSPYTISTAEDLAGFSQLVSSGKDSFKGKTILLGADIQLNTQDETALKDFPSIGTSTDFAFEGTFDGQDHTISGLYTTGNGLFYTGNNCVIKNLNVADATVSSSNPTTAVIIGYCLGESTIQNCHVRDSSVYVTSVGTGDIGGIAGLVCSGHIQGCSVTNCKVICAYTDYTGGIVGYADDASDFSNCAVKDSIILCGKSGVGGILGYGFTDVTFSTCAVDNCHVESTNDNYAGGIVGYGGSETSFDGCTVSNSEIKAYKHSVGGLVGYAYHALFSGAPSKVVNTVISSEIEEYVGGFVGSTNKPVTISTSDKCELTSSRIVGGIGGYSTNVGVIVGRGTVGTDAGKIAVSSVIIGNPNASATTDKKLFNLAGITETDDGWIIAVTETVSVNGQTYGTPNKVFDVPALSSENQNETAATPAPFLGLIAGLGAAGLIYRMRR